jgi:hypothetical protein
MPSPTLQAPPVQVVFRAYPPVPARLDAVPQSPAVRCTLAGAVLLAALVAGWWAGSSLGWIGPLVVSGLAGAVVHILWTGEYRVRSFVARCPACGRKLHLARGSRIRLPHPLRCPGCSRTCEVRLPPAGSPAREGASLRHLLPECTGSWRIEWYHDERFLACYGCGARHAATPARRVIADAENERGEVLARLTREGRFL